MTNRSPVSPPGGSSSFNYGTYISKHIPCSGLVEPKNPSLPVVAIFGGGCDSLLISLGASRRGAEVWRCCFDKRVLIGLGTVAALVFAVAPGWAVGALPALFALVCPLSMLLMMRGMNGGRSRHSAAAKVDAEREQELTLLRQQIDELRTASRPSRGKNDPGHGLERGYLRADDDRPARSGGGI